MKYGGFWKRFLALFLDAIIVGICLSMVSFAVRLGYGASSGTAEETEVLGSFIDIIKIILTWLYFALMESSRQQATLGKQAMGIIVTDLNGKKINFGRATGRYFGKFLSTIILMLGYIMAAFTQNKQALHDMLARTLVLSRR